MFVMQRRGRSTMLALTQRGGVVETGPYAGLNLATHVGDDLDRVRRHRGSVAAALGIPAEQMLFLDQVHGNDVVIAREPWPTPPRADAAVTATPGLHLAVLVADCVPVMLADDDAGVAGVAHAGRRGVQSHVVTATVAAMRELGATAIHAVVGPSICAGCYEVPAAMRHEVSAGEPTTSSHTRWGTPSLDLRAGVAAQLREAGIEPEMPLACTGEDERFYSYRREHGRTGRFAGIAGVLDSSDARLRRGHP